MAEAGLRMSLLDEKWEPTQNLLTRTEDSSEASAPLLRMCTASGGCTLICAT